MILGIDVSGSMEGVPIKEAKRGASIFLDQLDKEDFASLMVFGNSVRFLTEFTRKKHEIREKIESLKANEKLTFLYQATLKDWKSRPRHRLQGLLSSLLTDGKRRRKPDRERRMW